MTSGPFLVTERLILRPPSREDLDGFAAFHADAETMRFLGGPVGRGQSWRVLCTMAGAWSINGFSMFSLILRDTGQWIGRAGPWQPEGWPGTEVGWGILREYEGKGFAHEAALASIDYAFGTLGWSDVIHTIDPANSGSVALAQKLGATNRGPTRLPDPYQDVPVDAWGQSAEQWAARKMAQNIS
jgi:RimJ/RimL family protein N-acetyltransferase